MYKDFVNVTPESGGAGTTPIAVAADENEGAARRALHSILRVAV